MITVNGGSTSGYIARWSPHDTLLRRGQQNNNYTGQLYTAEAFANQGLNADEARAYYAKEGCAIGTVTAVEDEQGVWMNGRITHSGAHLADGFHPAAGDWRAIDGTLTLIAVLIVADTR